MNSNNRDDENHMQPWLESWPADGLESLQKCPICGETGREILHADLIDNAFRVGRGTWTLWKCANCGSAYLDPRPSQDSIYMAYTSYYTHREVAESEDFSSLSVGRKLRRLFVNGYTNWRFNTDAQPSSSLGVLVTFAIPGFKKLLDSRYRHILRPPASGGTLLDIGCGDGSYLGLARTCGWEVVGLDPDPHAVINAAKNGLTVYEGGIEYFAGKSEIFDVITLNHVIEHVHDPIQVLKACHSLLKPGGCLWLETPNINSFGHVRFQKNWRGLEAPRHLAILNRYSLKLALLNAGFTRTHELSRPSPCAGMFKKSFSMEVGFSPYQTVAIPGTLKWQIAIASFLEKLFPSRREFLTVLAKK